MILLHPRSWATSSSRNSSSPFSHSGFSSRPNRQSWKKPSGAFWPPGDKHQEHKLPGKTSSSAKSCWERDVRCSMVTWMHHQEHGGCLEGSPGVWKPRIAQVQWAANFLGASSAGLIPAAATFALQRPPHCGVAHS